MDTAWRAFQQTLERELGEELAETFVQSLHSRSQGQVGVARQFFYDLGKAWAPLVQAWSAWIEENARGETKAMILRDAKPLAALDSTQDWQQLYLNRLICGVPDELSGDGQGHHHRLLTRYLAQHGCATDFVLLDSGCYGTVVLELYKLGVSFRPLFFFSKNPFIRGFVNECGLSAMEGELLNDSMECGFPHMWVRPTELVSESGVVKVVLHPADDLSVQFGQAAMRGIADGQCCQPQTGREAAQALLRLSEQARKGLFTGVLGQASPEWSQKEAFLANWPTDLRWT